MANEVIAALIQGVCTIFAGAIAGSVAAKGIDSWRREAPGRRRVELAEQCLMKAFEVKSAISGFENKLANLIDQDLIDKPGEGYSLSRYFKGREEREAIVIASRKELDKMFAELENLTDLTALYFGDRLVSRSYALRSYFSNLKVLMSDYQNLCFDNHEPTPEKEALFAKLKPKYGTKEYTELQERRSDSIGGYKEVLGPHLNIADNESETIR